MRLFRWFRKGCDETRAAPVGDNGEAKAALERARNDRADSETDLVEAKKLGDVARMQRHKNHFAPEIYAVLESLRGER